MKKLLVAGVALLGWGSALAAPVTPDPAELPGGLSGKNVIHDNASVFNGQTVTTALGSLNTTSSEAIPKNWIGANTTSSITGVASLDGAGNSTAPVLTNKISSTGQIQSGSALGFSGNPLILQGISASADGAINPNTFFVGGIGKYDVSPVKITTPLIGHGDWSGCVLQAQDSVFEQYVRCGAGMDDGVVGMFKSTNQAPLMTLGGGAALSPSATSYTITFNSDGFTVRPAMTALDQKLLIVGERIYSNYYSSMQNSQSDGSNNTPLLYYGYYDSNTSGSDSVGTYTKILLRHDADTPGSYGWTLNPGTSYITTAPGSNSGDQRDTYISDYSSNAVLVGAAGKKFIFNTMLQLDPTVVNGTTRAGEGEELDLQLIDPDGYHKHDKFFTVHGKTIVLTGQDYAADDSYLERLAGSALMPLGLDIDGIKYGGQILHTDGGFQYYMQGDLNSITAGNYQLLSQIGSMNFNGTFGSLLEYGYKANNATSENNGWGNGEFHIGFQEKQDSGVMSGAEVACSGCASGGQIVFNPQGYHYGMGLGVGIGSSVTYGMIIPSSGPPILPNGVTVSGTATATDVAANQLRVTPASGSAYAYFDSSGPYSVTLESSLGGMAGLTVGSLTSATSLSVAGTLTAQANIDVAGDITNSSLAGTGNAYACLDSTGKLYRSSTACN